MHLCAVWLQAHCEDKTAHSITQSLCPLMQHLHLRYRSTSSLVATTPAATTSSIARFMPRRSSTRQLEMGAGVACNPTQHMAMPITLPGSECTAHWLGRADTSRYLQRSGSRYRY
jgi:hypothetical protein